MLKLSTLTKGICAAALVAGAAPLMAQPSEDITVTGRYGTVPDSVQTLSQAVSYYDLDLGTEAGRRELRQRVSLTARFLCSKLGESSTAPGPGNIPSCQQGATKDAMERVGTIEQGFAPRGTAWVRPKAWTSPYPADWATKYPYTYP